jgi:hypothetical protein
MSAAGAAAYSGQAGIGVPSQAQNSYQGAGSQSGSQQIQSTSQGNQAPPAGQYQAPATQYQAPANQYQAPPTQYQAPPTQYQVPPSQSARPSTTSDDDGVDNEQEWTQKLGWHDDEDRLPGAGTGASKPSSTNIPNTDSAQASAPPPSRDLGTNDLEQIPTPAKDSKKPAASRAKQQDISPAFLKKEDNAYNPNFKQELKRR